MFRKVFISFLSIVALSIGSAGIASDAEAKKKPHHRQDYDDGMPLSFFFGFPGHGHHSPTYFNDYYYQDCGYRRVAIRKWNKAHTKRIKVYKKRWVCD